MGRNNYFQFKQFRIDQANSAMKVGVDGVLLGAWTELIGARNILDVGTGTGLIALMLAQRSKAHITAIEIEDKAAKEAAKNVKASPWRNRISVQHVSFQHFNREFPSMFDLIVSNPPFFNYAYKAAGSERNLARHNDKLLLSELIEGAVWLLNEAGKIALILPVSELNSLEKLALKNRFYLQRFTEIKPKPSKSANRMLVQLGKTEHECEKSMLTIYNDDNSFTEAYKELTRDFYLKF